MLKKGIVYIGFSLAVLLLSITSIHATRRFDSGGDSCWNKVMVSCDRTMTRKQFRIEDAAPLTVSDLQLMDSLGIITEVTTTSDVVITVKKHTAWLYDTDSLVLRHVATDSTVEHYRWECEYAGPNKGNCSTCQPTDCDGNKIGHVKNCKDN